MIIIEKARKSKLKRTRYESSGHDCWGNSESTSYDYVVLEGGEIVDIYDSQYVIHDGKFVLELGYMGNLPDNIRMHLDEELFRKIKAEEKERRYKKYLELKKEFEKDPIYIRDQKIDKIID
jgi:hypothetical protein